MPHYFCSDPQWSSPNKGSVDVIVYHPEFGWIPFTAMPNVLEPMGHTIYHNALAGAYGDVAPYIDRTLEEE